MAEEVILNKSSDGNHVERFLEYAEEVKRPPAPAAAGPVLKIEKSSLAQQIEFLRSLKGTVSCDAEHVKPDPGCEALDVCRLEGPQETQKMAEKIIADKHQHRLKY